MTSDAPPPGNALRYPPVMAAGAVIVSGILAAVYFTHAQDAPFFANLVLDEAAYDARARAILAGDFWLAKEGVFYQDPLYPYLLALIYAVAGSEVIAAHAVQLACVPLLVASVYALGQRAFDARIGAWAAMAAALYWPLYFFGGLLHKALPTTVLFTGALFFLCDRHRRRRNYVFAGVLFGLCALLRGNFLVLIPVAAVLAGWMAGDPPLEENTSAPPRKFFHMISWAGCALFVAGCAVVIAPVTIRNTVVGGDAVLITYQGGPNMYVGNHPGNLSGSYQAPPFVRATPAQERWDFTREAERRAGRALTPSEVDSFWYAETGRYIRDNPGEFLRNTLMKLMLLANAREVSDNVSPQFYRDRYVPLLRAPLLSYGIVFPFALLGLASTLWFARGDRYPARAVRVAAILGGAYAATLLITYIVGRYRIPLVPIVLIFAAAGVFEAYRLVIGCERTAGRVVAAGVILVISGILAFLPVRNEHRETPFYVLGNVYLRQGNRIAAQAEYVAALGHNSRHIPSLMNLGWIAFEAHDDDRARGYFERVLAADSEYANAYYGLARIAHRAGDTDAALRALRKLAGLRAYDERVLRGGLVLARDMGDDAVARRFQEQLKVFD